MEVERANQLLVLSDFAPSRRLYRTGDSSYHQLKHGQLTDSRADLIQPELIRILNFAYSGIHDWNFAPPQLPPSSS